MKLETLPLSPDPEILSAALPVLEDVLAGHRAVLPVSPDAAGRDLARTMGADGGTDGAPEAPGTLVACTSGSTGTPKGARLRTANLTASADATASYLATRFGARPGRWLLALPPHHIAGVQVILRSLHAGFTPAVLPPDAGFTPETFAAATARLRAQDPGQDIYTSLVPTQLHRLIADAAGRDALRAYSAILVGGAATPPELEDRCRAEGVRTVLTYGSSETAGGMVYDGTPVPGSRVDIDGTTGRILLSGPTVADGYRNVDPDVQRDAFPEPGVFRTGDLGHVTDGVLRVSGRADGAVNSGGLKILPEEVEAALQQTGLTACVVGVPDEEWGQIVVAAVEDPTAPELSEVTDVVRRTLHDAGTESHLIPRRTFTVGTLPLTGPGKLDRRGVAALLETRLKA